jgi:ribose 5-phosphate isomerase B
MLVAVAFDHAGFVIKHVVLDAIYESGCEVLDLGTDGPEPVDYPDFAEKLGKAIQEGKAERGILVCGSGVGACIAANKMIGVYAGLCHDTYSAHQGVEHDDMNVLCLGSRVIGPELAKEIIRAFLAAKFSAEERHVRRVGKVRELEGEEREVYND